MLNKEELVTLYRDYQQNKEPLGVARLRQFVKFGYPFILEEMRETVQPTYVCEYWEIDWVEKYVDTINPERYIYPIRTLLTTGLSPSSDISGPVEQESDYLLDKFIVIHGIEVF